MIIFLVKCCAGLSTQQNHLKWLRIIRISSAILLGAVCCVGTARDSKASYSSAEYVDALKIAGKHIQKMHSASAGGVLAEAIPGSAYALGEAWEVAAFQQIGQLAEGYDLHHADPLEAKGRIGVFRYRVVSVTSGASAGVQVEVTQQNALGFAPIDRNVQILKIAWNSAMQQIAKSYVMGVGDPDHWKVIPVSPSGLRAHLSPLELFPLDVPYLRPGDATPAIRLPQLPSALQAIARKVGFQPELSRCRWIETMDPMGRAVDVLWQAGDPWPTYLKTSQGVAILIRKGDL